MLASVSLDDGVAPLILQLLQCALCGSKAVEQSKSGNTGTAAGSTSSSTGGSTSSAASAVSPAKSKREDRIESKSSADSKKKEGNKAGANSDYAVSLNYGDIITAILPDFYDFVTCAVFLEKFLLQATFLYICCFEILTERLVQVS